MMISFRFSSRFFRRPALSMVAGTFGALALLLLVACGGGAEGPTEEAGESSPDATAASSPAAGELEAVAPDAWFGTVTVGGDADADGLVPEADRSSSFTVGDVVFVSASLEGEPPVGATVRVVFKDAEGEVVAEDEKKARAGAAALLFTAVTDGWMPGRYEAEVSADGELMGTGVFDLDAATD